MLSDNLNCLRRLRGSTGLVLSEERQHLAIEGRQVGGLAAADPIAVSKHLGILPFGPGIPEIVLNSVVAGYLSTGDEASRHEQPRPMTNDGDGFSRPVNRLDEILRLRYDTKRVRIERSAR